MLVSFFNNKRRQDRTIFFYVPNSSSVTQPAELHETPAHWYSLNSLQNLLLKRNGFSVPHKSLPVAETITASVFVDQVNADKSCARGYSWHWDGVYFEFLNRNDSNYTRENDYSCVLRISNSHTSALLTGDIEADAERHLVEDGLKPVDILVAPHHGSNTSSTAEFIIKDSTH